MTSLDYAMWFKAPVFADRWMRFDLRPEGSLGTRVLINGSVHAGPAEVASFATELLFQQPAQ
jgi:acyl-CoA thioesterase